MKENITIREYNSGDKPCLVEILRLNTPACFAREEEVDFIHYLNNEIDLYYVIEVDNVVTGCGGINFADNRATGKISWDILHPEYQGRSLGTQLLRHRIAILQSIKSVQQIIVRTSQLAYRFYEKQGFQLIEVVHDYWAKGFDMYFMKYKGI